MTPATTSTSELHIPEVVVTDPEGQRMPGGMRRARSSSPTSRSTDLTLTRASASSASLVNPADIITFRFMGESKRRGKQVWVDTPATYDAAVDRVITEFRHDLGHLDRRDIALCVAAHAGKGGDPVVRIGRSDEAWQRVISTLVRYEIIEVHVDAPDLPALPTYSQSTTKGEKAEVGWAPATQPLCAGQTCSRKSLQRRIAFWLRP